MTNILKVVIVFVALASVALGSPNFGLDHLNEESERGKRDISPGKHWFTVEISKICGEKGATKGPAFFLEIYLKDGAKNYTKITKTKSREISLSTNHGSFEMAFYIIHTPKITQLVEIQIYHDPEGTNKGPLFGTVTDIPIFKNETIGEDFDIALEDKEDGFTCGDEKPFISFILEK